MPNDIKLSFECPELLKALNNLAEAILNNTFIQLPEPAPTAPTAPITPPVQLTPAAQIAPPQYAQPQAPVYQPPAPTYQQPAPQQYAPAPVYQQTAPVVAYPQPIAQPAPQPQQAPVAGLAYTAEQIASAAAPLMDAGRGAELIALLARYNVQALTQLSPDLYGALATDLRALAAKI
jgi:hypothetical protein